MSHKNYTRYSKMNGEEPMLINEPEIVVENENAIIEQPIEGQTMIPEVEPEMVTEVNAIVETIPETEPEPAVELTMGRVYGCKKLNVRKLPAQDAKILCELIERSEVMIDEKASTALFYKVCTESGVEGYCVKKFVKILQ